MSNPKPKLFILCVDGARYPIIKDWIDKGYLPTFKKIMDNGVHGILESVLPGPHSAIAYMTMATGKKPEKHGYIYTFMPLGENKFKLFHSTSVKERKLWDIISENNLKVGMMDLPLTYPPTEINGFMISAAMTPAFAKKYTYPENLRKIMDNYMGCQTIDCYRRDKKSLQNLYEYTELRTQAIELLLNEYPVDVFFKHFCGTESLHHIYSSFNSPEHHQYSPHYMKIVRDYYGFLDKKIGNLIDKYPKSTFLIFSDHGSCAVKNKIYLNNVLKELGLFVSNIKQSKTNNLKRLIISKLAYIYFRFPFKLQKLIRGFFPQKIGDKLYKPITIDADWQNSIAYAFTWGMVFVNKAHKDYKPENHFRIVDEVYQKLNSFPLIKENSYKIYKKEEIFGKESFDYFPDLYIHFHEDHAPKYNASTDKLIEPCTDIIHAQHTKDGMFFLYGKDIKKNYLVKDISMLDLAPTILHLLDLPVPSDMEGQVFQELFEDNSYPGQRKVRSDYKTFEKEKIKQNLDEIDF